MSHSIRYFEHERGGEGPPPPDSSATIRAAYLGKSSYADPYGQGSLDGFRVYGKTLTAAEVTAPAE